MKVAVLAHHVAPIRPPFAGGVESVTWYAQPIRTRRAVAA